MHLRLRQEHGAAAVEFAIVASVLVMLVFGVLEFGLAFWQVQNLRSATREGARVAAVRGSFDQVGAAMVNASTGSLPSGFSGFTLSIDGVLVTGVTGATRVCTLPNTTGKEVTVTVTNILLSSSVLDAFKIDIPFVPAYTMAPKLSGTFRCE